MSGIDYNNANSIEPASCFDEVKHGRGRPRKVINAVGAKVIEALASVMCTEEEIAACLGVTVETLKNDKNEALFLECYKRGQDLGKMSLRRNQFELSKVNATMAIFLGKQYLGQSDRGKQPESDEVSPLDKLCDALTKVINDE